MDYYEADNLTTELVQDKEPQAVEHQLQAAGQALAREISALSKVIPWAGINRFLTDVVEAIDGEGDTPELSPGTESDATSLYHSASTESIKARIRHLQGAPALFLRLTNQSADWPAFQAFDEAFSVEENEEEITHLLEHCGELSETMLQLVPELFTQEQAWARYFFLSAQIRLGRPIGVDLITSSVSESDRPLAETQKSLRGRIQLTASFETVKVSEAARSCSEFSEASYDFVSRQQSPARSISNISALPEDSARGSGD